MNDETKLKYLSSALYVFGTIMIVQAMSDTTEKDNLIGDVPALFLVAFVLWFLMPKSSAE